MRRPESEKIKDWLAPHQQHFSCASGIGSRSGGGSYNHALGCRRRHFSTPLAKSDNTMQNLIYIHPIWYEFAFYFKIIGNSKGSSPQRELRDAGADVRDRGRRTPNKNECKHTACKINQRNVHIEADRDKSDATKRMIDGVIPNLRRGEGGAGCGFSPTRCAMPTRPLFPFTSEL